MSTIFTMLHKATVTNLYVKFVHFQVGLNMHFVKHIVDIKMYIKKAFDCYYHTSIYLKIRDIINYGINVFFVHLFFMQLSFGCVI